MKQIIFPRSIAPAIVAVVLSCCHIVEAANPAIQPIVIKAARFVITPPVSQLSAQSGSSLRTEQIAPPAPPALKPLVASTTAPPPEPPLPDPLLITAPAPIGTMPPPLMTFEGLSIYDNEDVQVNRPRPSDANGDIGPNHYVETVNLVYRVFDRSGKPLTPPLKYSTLFASLGSPAANFDDGDPTVRYDSMADRWILSLFVVSSWFDTNGPSHQVIAVSKTGDPTGQFYVYDFPMPNDYLNDYPKLGVWPDAYYLSINQFNHNLDFISPAVFACDRSKLLAGDSSAQMVFFDLQSFSGHPSSLLPGDLDGAPPATGTPNVFICATSPQLMSVNPPDHDGTASSDQNATGNDSSPVPPARYGLRLFQLIPDFSNLTNSTFAETGFIPTSPFHVFDGDGISIPQRGTTNNLDALSNRLLYRLQFRHFAEYDSLVVNHTVQVSTNGTAGIRYYQLKRFPPGGAFFLDDEGTFSPDHESRWMGSAALDWQGNLAIGYSASSRATFPSIRYAGRSGSQPSSGLNMAEALLYPGSASQTFYRWGDYTMLAVDPVDESTFWYVNQYYTNFDAGAWHTRVGTFKFPNTPIAPKADLHASILDDQTGKPIDGAVVTTANGYWRQTQSTNGCSFRLVPGTYALSAVADDYQSAPSVLVTLDNGAQVSTEIRLTRLANRLRLVQMDDLAFAGPWHGPFTPSSIVCKLSNTGSLPAPWNAYWDSSWLLVSPTRGVLAPGATASLTLQLQTPADNLPPQLYRDMLVIANDSGSNIIDLPVTLAIQRTAGTIALNSSSVMSNEGDAFVNATVLRNDGTDGTVEVDLATRDGSAHAGVDYQPENRTLVFAHGETNKTVPIRLIPSSTPPSKSFSLSLSNPRNGAELGAISDATVTILKTNGLIAREFLDKDPKWQTTGQWAFGVPQGVHDPTAGNTGTNVYGYNLAGDYTNNLPATEYLTSPAFDCSKFYNVQLYFWRWLGVERSLSDLATVEASNDGSTWHVVWTNSSVTFTRDTNWNNVSYDISAIADRQSKVYIRWGLGPTDSSLNLGGWNIDDIELFGTSTDVLMQGNYDASKFADVLMWSSSPGQLYSLEFKRSLAELFQPLGPDVAATPPRNVYTNWTHFSDKTRFYRIRIKN